MSVCKCMITLPPDSYNVTVYTLSQNFQTVLYVSVGQNLNQRAVTNARVKHIADEVVKRDCVRRDLNVLYVGMWVGDTDL